MRQSLQEQKNATVYQYRLIRKMNIHPKLLLSYKTIPFIFLAAGIIVYGWNGVLYGLVGLPITVLLRFVLNRLTLLRVDNYQRQRWGWSISIPFMGYVPLIEVPLGLFRRTEMVMFWIGLCLIGMLLPWIGPAGFFGLAAWHIWLAIPTLTIVTALRRQKHDGVVKLETECIQYYHR